MSTIIYVLSRNMKNSVFFFIWKFSFFGVKFSIYMDRHVFVMFCSYTLSLFIFQCDGDWLHLIDFPLLSAREATFRTSYLHSYTPSPSENRCILKRNKFAPEKSNFVTFRSRIIYRSMASIVKWTSPSKSTRIICSYNIEIFPVSF